MASLQETDEALEMLLTQDEHPLVMDCAWSVLFGRSLKCITYCTILYPACVPHGIVDQQARVHQLISIVGSELHQSICIKITLHD